MSSDVTAYTDKINELMNFKLTKNSHKGHWANLDTNYLLDRAQMELEEFKQAIKENPADAPSEAADINNFLMMILDNLGLLNYDIGTSRAIANKFDTILREVENNCNNNIEGAKKLLVDLDKDAQQYICNNFIKSNESLITFINLLRLQLELPATCNKNEPVKV